MPQRSATSSSSPAKNAFWFDTMASPDGAFGNLMKNAQSAIEDSYRTMSDETLQFINKRLEHNSEAMEQCRDCRDVSALMSVQQKWIMDMAHDYYDEAARMGEVTRKVLVSGLPTNGASAHPTRAEKHAQ